MTTGPVWVWITLYSVFGDWDWKYDKCTKNSNKKTQNDFSVKLLGVSSTGHLIPPLTLHISHLTVKTDTRMLYPTRNLRITFQLRLTMPSTGCLSKKSFLKIHCTKNRCCGPHKGSVSPRTRQVIPKQSREITEHFSVPLPSESAVEFYIKAKFPHRPHMVSALCITHS